MHETPDEVAGLQRLIDASFTAAGRHLTSIVSDQRRLSAADLVAYLTGVKHLVVATVTASGEPRVSAVDGLFLHGEFWFSTAATSVKARHLAGRPGVSAAHVVGDSVGVFVHGRAELVRGGTTESSALAPLWREVYAGGSPEDWVEEPSLAVYVRIRAHRVLTYAFDRARFEALVGEASTGA